MPVMSSSRLERAETDPPAADVEHARAPRKAGQLEEALMSAPARAGGEGEAIRANGPLAVA